MQASRASDRGRAHGAPDHADSGRPGEHRTHPAIDPSRLSSGSVLPTSLIGLASLDGHSSLGPLRGRTTELDQLADFFQRALREGGALVITGEPGVARRHC